MTRTPAWALPGTRCTCSMLTCVETDLQFGVRSFQLLSVTVFILASNSTAFVMHSLYMAFLQCLLAAIAIRNDGEGFWLSTS